MLNQTVQKIYLLGTDCQSLSYVIFSDEFNFQIRIRYIETAHGNMNQKYKLLRSYICCLRLSVRPMEYTRIVYMHVEDIHQWNMLRAIYLYRVGELNERTYITGTCRERFICPGQVSSMRGHTSLEHAERDLSVQVR